MVVLLVAATITIIMVIVEKKGTDKEEAITILSLTVCIVCFNNQPYDTFCTMSTFDNLSIMRVSPESMFVDSVQYSNLK